MYKISCLLFILIPALMAGCSKTAEKNKKDGKQPKKMSAEAIKAVAVDFKHSYSFTGNLLANEAVDIKSEIQGRVTKINFIEGSKVKKGQLLIKIFDNDLQAQLSKAKLVYDLALKDENRKAELLKINGISREEYDISLNKLKTAEADKELIAAQIAKTEITAPFAGIIGLRQISEGAFVSSASQITTLQQTDPVKIDFSVPEKQSSEIKIGSTIEFTVSGSDKKYKAAVYACESKVDNVTGTVKFRARCPNPDNSLSPGAFANVYAGGEKNRKSILIPAGALIPELDLEQVILIKNGKAKRSPVKTGVRTSDKVEIIDGVNEGDTIAVSGLLQIKTGMQVTPRFKDEKKKN